MFDRLLYAGGELEGCGIFIACQSVHNYYEER